MDFVRKIVGVGKKALTDIAMGVIIVHLAGKVFGYNIPVYFYPIGAFLSLLPDIDYPCHLWLVWRQKRDFYKTHRMVSHWPIMIIPICLILGVLSIFWPVFHYWTVVATLCLLSHYIHDSIGTEKIRWLAPWGKRYYGLGGKKRAIVSWNEEEWNAWVRAKKKIVRKESLGYVATTTKELIVGCVLSVAAMLIVYFWR